MDEKIEEMKEIIAKAIREYLEEEGITQLYIKGRKDGTSTKIISKALYNAGYRKESDTARELVEELVKESDKKIEVVGDCDEEEYVAFYTIPDYKLKEILESRGVEVE